MWGTTLDIKPCIFIGKSGLMVGDAPNLSHQGFATSPKPTALDFQPPSNYRVSLKEGYSLQWLWKVKQ